MKKNPEPAGLPLCGQAAGPPALTERFPELSGWHIGVDEAGRGCLAGPVCAAALLAPPGLDLAQACPGLDDSKAMSEKKREALAGRIRQITAQGKQNDAAGICASGPVFFGLGFSQPREIDRVNILNATFRAMSRALIALHQQLRSAALRQSGPPDWPPGWPTDPDFFPALFIDGPHSIPLPQWELALNGLPLELRGPQRPGRARKGGAGVNPNEAAPSGGPDFAPALLRALGRQRPVVDGDALIPAISAASILAKTARDALMPGLDQRFPGYDFARHKGYGTKAHLEALKKLGASPAHRKSFGPCAAQPAQAGLFD